MAVIKVDEKNFENEVLKADKLVLVDFFATWCGPCQMLSPIVDKVSEEVADLKVCKLDTDMAPSIAVKYGVRSIPTLILFKNGEAVSASVGAISKSDMINFINSAK